MGSIASSVSVGGGNGGDEDDEGDVVSQAARGGEAAIYINISATTATARILSCLITLQSKSITLPTFRLVHLCAKAATAP